MKVLLLFNEMPHYGFAAAKRIAFYSRGLENSGVENEIIIPFGFISRAGFDFTKEGRLNGAKYRYLSFIPFHPRNRFVYPVAVILFIFKKILGYLKLLNLLVFERKKYDIVFIYEFSILYTLVIQLLTFNKITVAELCEIPYFAESGQKKHTLRWLREQLNYRYFKGFLTISKNLQKYVMQLNFKRNTTLVVPILVDPVVGTPDQCSSNPSLIDGRYIIHTGTLHEEKDGIKGMITAFGRAINDLPVDIKFVFTGNLNDSSENNAIRAIMDDFKITDRIVFLGYVNEKDIDCLLIHADMAIINKPVNEQNFYNFPTKLGDYLTHSIPVIITSIGEMAAFIEDDINGFIVEPQNTEKLEEKIKYVFLSKTSKKVGNEGRKLAIEQLIYIKHGERIKTYFEQLLNHN